MYKLPTASQILHCTDDPSVPKDQAIVMTDAVNGSGGHAELRILESSGEVTVRETWEKELVFLQSVIGPASDIPED